MCIHFIFQSHSNFSGASFPALPSCCKGRSSPTLFPAFPCESSSHRPQHTAFPLPSVPVLWLVFLCPSGISQKLITCVLLFEFHPTPHGEQSACFHIPKCICLSSHAWPHPVDPGMLLPAWKPLQGVVTFIITSQSSGSESISIGQPSAKTCG